MVFLFERNAANSNLTDTVYAKEFDTILELLRSILEEKHSKQTFVESYQLIYDFILNNNVELFLDKTLDFIKTIFYKINLNIKEVCGHCDKILCFFRDIFLIKQQISLLLGSVSVLYGIDIVKRVDDTVLTVSHRLLNVESLFKYLNEYLMFIRSNEMNNKCVGDLRIYGNIIEFVFPSEKKQFIDEIMINSSNYILNLIHNIDIVGFPSLKITELLKKEVDMFNNIFCNESVSFKQLLYDNILNNNGFKIFFKKLGFALTERDESYILNFFSFLDQGKIPKEVQNVLIQVLSQALHQSKIDIVTLSKRMTWCQSLFDDFDNEDLLFIMTQSFSQVINKNEKEIFSQCMSYIEKNTDISPIKPILRYNERSHVFESMHTKKVARKLLMPVESEIDDEIRKVNQILSFSSNYKFAKLKQLFIDAKDCLNNKFNNTLIVFSASWPFRLPHYDPILLSHLSNDIYLRYKQLYPQRYLKFNIYHWLLSIHDNFRNFDLLCDGIQAEILMYLNRNQVITKHSIPEFGADLTYSVLESLSCQGCPVLKRIDRLNYVATENNEALKGEVRAPSYQIPEKNFDDERDKIRQQALTFHIARLVKRHRCIKYTELFDMLITENSSLFTVNETTVNTSINELTHKYIVTFDRNSISYMN